jgi:metal-dependent amidase/aminoacylase/carboxypeptidase family protein
VAFNIGTIQGGRSQSSLAESVEITGTIRTHDPIVRQRLKKTIERVCNGTTTTFDLATKIVWANEMPILENSPELVSLALKALPESNITTIKIDTPPLASDDFALLSELGPLLYLKLGVAEKEERLAPPLHAGNFDVNEDCIEVGISVLEILVDKINEGMKS